MKATEQDFIDLMNLLQKREDEERSYVMITGQQGFENFHFSLMGCDVYISVNNIRYNFRKVPYLWIFNIYEKHGPYKITLNCKTKKFKAYYGTIELGETNTAESAFKLYIKKHKDERR
jgi:hypothetical protein